jgi:hypothetical protein
MAVVGHDEDETNPMTTNFFADSTPQLGYGKGKEM